jgi:hypothetical protein
MRYPDALRTAPWIVLAVTVWRSGTGTVLLGLAQRFTSQEKNAPRTTPMGVVQLRRGSQTGIAARC